MNANPGLAIPSFIGQTLAETFAGVPTLGAIRSPEFLPDGVSAFLFESHWGYYLALAAVAVVAIVAGSLRGQRQATRVGVGLLAATVAWMLLGILFDSPMERLNKAHYAVLEAAKASDAAAVRDLLADDFTFGPQDRTHMGQIIEATFALLKVKDTMVMHYHARPTDVPRTAQSEISVLTRIEGPVGSGSHLTRWVLEWTDVPGRDWRVRSILKARYGPKDSEQEIPPDLIPKF